VRFGHSELMGRTVGLLLSAEEALTTDEIAARLGVSKSPINQIARRLEELNLVRRIRKPGDRKHYYEISPRVFLQAATNLYRLYEENLRVAERTLRSAFARLERAKSGEAESLRLLCERVIDMREFHLHLVEAFKHFLEEWNAAELQLPAVDTYAKRLKATARAARPAL
jgi:DNA-binding transcriptional regulator GbsR (MarR family)